MNLESLHAISTMVAKQRNVESVLKTVVDSLVQSSDLALARIWLTQPGDICETCVMRSECPNQSQCLHLVASAGRPQNPDSGEDWSKLDGFYRRFPLGIRKVGVIGRSGESMKLCGSVAEDRAWFARGDWLRREGVQSFCGHPLVFREQILGVLAIFSRSFVSDQEFAWLRAFADSAAVAIANARAFQEIEELKAKLELENEYLREEIRTDQAFGGIVGKSLGLNKVLEQVELVAPTDTSVLILGESGVGKELIARAIHDRSDRADRSLVKVNCASIPRDLFESEFFGHVEGSFTGATRDRTGRFELADGGTLFLDEVGEIPLDMQSKLLRVLQDGAFERIGEERTRSANVRIVAATNRDLQVEVAEKRFRQDLYYRLSVFPVDVPPLRDRKEDIPQLALHFLERSCRKLGSESPKLRQRHIIELQQYDWPGNIRELQNVVERAAITSRSGPLQFLLPRTESVNEQDHASDLANDHGELMTDAQIKDRERKNILAVLEQTDWKISGSGGAAEFLGINPATLTSRMRSMGISKPK
ncbi:MAG: sigma 54-interacting transcriptional regulator [Pirellulales bacterium]|nr:sigma 54-interacting transcriptional regulator [Pirellulales bacterium]